MKITVFFAAVMLIMSVSAAPKMKVSSGFYNDFSEIQLNFTGKEISTNAPNATTATWYATHATNADVRRRTFKVNGFCNYSPYLVF